MSLLAYLVVYHSRLFAAHWSIWIPNKGEGIEGKGKVIHVEGTVSQGFNHEFKRNYDMAMETRQKSILPLGSINACYIKNIHEPEGETQDSIATDAVEELALHIPAPGPSLRRAFGSGSKTRIELKNCQTWLKEYVGLLIEKGILPAEALQVVDGAPKN